MDQTTYSTLLYWQALWLDPAAPFMYESADRAVFRGESGPYPRAYPPGGDTRCDPEGEPEQT